ncbi:hypothetical protein N7528_009919 [Penicillium herquei]|nr:hypothetical protein N7528_009919 [Penicillium herquei]
MNAWGGMTDLMLGIYPGFLIRNLRIPLKTKILTCCLMGLGVIASAFGFGKVGWLSVDIHNGTKAIPPSVAFFFYGEAWLLVVTTSIAPLWPLIKRLKWTRKHDKSVEVVESTESVES